MTAHLPTGRSAKLPVTIIVMTRDEAVNIDACLASCVPYCAQVVVVDSSSIDGTAAIAAKHGVEIINFRWNGRYPKKKQWCLENLNISQPWTMLLDADEQLTPAMRTEMAERLSDDAVELGFYITAQVGYDGRILRHGRKHRKLSLFRTDAARFPEIDDLDIQAMWEVEGHYQPIINGPIGRFAAPIIHLDAKGRDAWISRHRRYALWAAEMRRRDALRDVEAAEPLGRRVAKRTLNRVPAKPLLAWADSYLWQQGWRDGRAGLAYAADRFRYYRAIDRAHRVQRVQ
ncbi:MAG: glycosyltransferase family 2 protein [Alphaproteobacteria bacterium]|nr:glycosyltransferase family 2 protein [Alphaproteobacteria bacterium SS10]